MSPLPLLSEDRRIPNTASTGEPNDESHPASFLPSFIDKLSISLIIYSHTQLFCPPPPPPPLPPPGQKGPPEPPAPPVAPTYTPPHPTPPLTAIGNHRLEPCPCLDGRLFPQPADCVQWPDDQARGRTARQINISLSLFGDHGLCHVTFFSPGMSSTSTDLTGKPLTLSHLRAGSLLWKLCRRGYVRLGEKRGQERDVLEWAVGKGWECS